MQRSRNMDSLQGFMNSFKQFEKKLDKLQDDVNYHGNTLSDLRSMVANLVSVSNYEMKMEEQKRTQRKSVALQYDVAYKPRRVETMQPHSNKLMAKSYQGQKYGLAKPIEVPYHSTKKGSLPMVKKHQRLLKGESPRKATTLRAQKPVVKKHTKNRK